MRAKEKILDQFPALSPTLRAAARFIVDHPNDVVISSMRTLAEHAKAQPSTLVRLAQQLGFSGWPELKSAFAEDLGLRREGYGERAKNLTTRGKTADLVGELFSAQQANLVLTEALCASALKDAAKALKKSRSVHVAGFRASFPVAYALVYGYRLFRDSVHLIDGQGGGLEMQMRSISKQDVVVAISFAPYSRESLAVVEAARTAGAKIIALTDSNASPLALASDVPVLFSATSPSFFPSVAAAVAVTEALLELLVADAGEGIVKKIDQTEQSLFESGAYLQAPTRRTPIR
ncbi:MurR/RpiR family transcriptional regulator [Rhodoferax ferrireducens]|uniref:MurR/RpiR family transcriptional regulator n=1 Tax=Rhodoferax ferrireducens TaxID=192843 RepID=UPI000E0DB172|nr:MurR/RpiR family transcriptional regulator [Rhodoferax ferrireducens]